MIIQLSDYKNRKNQSMTRMVKVPVFDNVFIEENKLMGKQRGTGKILVIKDYGEDEEINGIIQET